MRQILCLAITSALLAACESRQSTPIAPSGTASGTVAVTSKSDELARTAASSDATSAEAPVAVATELDGAALYATSCQMCHQASGAGLPNAFPPLKGSPIVNNADATQLVTIILKGYNARPEYGAMPGYEASLNDEKIAAIATYVRTSWGNAGSVVSPGIVGKLRNNSK